MTDRKPAVGDDNDETASHTALLAEDYDSDASNVEHLDFTQLPGTVSYSVGRLEQDLQTLHKKWQLVEQEMSAREQQVLNLQDELNAILTDRDSLVTQKHALEDALEAEIDASGSKREHFRELETRNNELRAQVQELEDYIDRRKTEWAKLESRVRDYEDTIKGMGSSVESHEAVLAQKDEENAQLVAKLAEMEQDLAKLSGQHGEREASHSDLQQSLKDQSRELGALNDETASLKKEIGKLEKKLTRRNETIASLRKELEDHQRNELRVDAVLESEKAAISDLQKQHEARIAELELAVKNGEVLEQQLRGETSQAADTIEDLRNKVAELEIRTAELDAMHLESESERQSTEAELEAQRGLVETLEREVSGKGGDIDLMDVNVERLSAIGEGIRALDIRIDSQWSEPQKLSQDVEEIFEHADEILISPEELMDDPTELAEHFFVTDDDSLDEQVRYPLVGKSVTIGRAHESDIRINSKYISRNHVRILINGSVAIIEDAGSTNGFSVNDRRVSRHRLANGDTLRLGKSRFRYEYTTP